MVNLFTHTSCTFNQNPIFCQQDTGAGLEGHHPGGCSLWKNAKLTTQQTDIIQVQFKGIALAVCRQWQTRCFNHIYPLHDSGKCCLSKPSGR